MQRRSWRSDTLHCDCYGIQLCCDKSKMSAVKHTRTLALKLQLNHHRSNHLHMCLSYFGTHILLKDAVVIMHYFTLQIGYTWLTANNPTMHSGRFYSSKPALTLSGVIQN